MHNFFTISGGLGFGNIEDCIVTEELYYGCTGIGAAIGTNLLAVSNQLEL